MTNDALPSIETTGHEQRSLFTGRPIVLALPEQVQTELRAAALENARILAARGGERPATAPNRTYPALEGRINAIAAENRELLGEEQVKIITENVIGVSNYLMVTALAVASADRDNERKDAAGSEGKGRG